MAKDPNAKKSYIATIVARLNKSSIIVQMEMVFWVDSFVEGRSVVVVYVCTLQVLAGKQTPK